MLPYSALGQSSYVYYKFLAKLVQSNMEFAMKKTKLVLAGSAPDLS